MTRHPKGNGVLGEIQELVAQDPELALQLIAALPATLRGTPDLLLLEAEAHGSAERWARVIEVLTPLIGRDAENSDAHHLLGVAYGGLGDEELCRKHFLRTLELDARADAGETWLSEEASDEMARQARAVLEELPTEYAQRLGNVLVVLEERPSRELVDEGFDPRAYGLFEGLDHADQLSQQLTTRITRIVLFAANLLADFPDSEDLAQEVRVTVLHEVGHYFGLDEEDMVRLGLD